MSKEHLEEFKAHLHCLGFTEDEVFFVSEKVRALPEGGQAPAHRLGRRSRGGGCETGSLLQPRSPPAVPSSWGSFWGEEAPTAALPLSPRTPVPCLGRRRVKKTQRRSWGNPHGLGWPLHPHPPPAPPWGQPRLPGLSSASGLSIEVLFFPPDDPRHTLPGWNRQLSRSHPDLK